VTVSPGQHPPSGGPGRRGGNAIPRCAGPPEAALRPRRGVKLLHERFLAPLPIALCGRRKSDFVLFNAAGVQPDAAVAFTGNRAIMGDDNQGCAAIAF